MSYPDLTQAFTRASQLADQMSGNSTVVSSASTKEATGFEKEVEELLLKETKQQQLDEYRADFMSAWLIKRTKADKGRYKYFGANTGSLGALVHKGDLNAKGVAEDRLVVLTELINLITGSETTGQISGLLDITQKAYEREDGKAGKYSPYIKELYAAGLGLNGISDSQIEKLLNGEKYKGKTYTLKDISNDQRFIIDAHKKMLDRKENLGNMVEDFSYSKLGIFGKVSEFNWFGHQMLAGAASGVIMNQALGRSIGFKDAANFMKHEGKFAEIVGNSKAYNNVVASTFQGKNARTAAALRFFNRNSFQEGLIARLGPKGAATQWTKAMNNLALTTLDDAGKYSLVGANGKLKSFAADKVDDAAKFLIKNGSAYKNVSGWRKLGGFAATVGKGIFRTGLGRSFKGIGIAALAGFAISGLFAMKEKGGFKATAQELGGHVYDLGKDVLGPLDLIPDYGSAFSNGSWAA